VDKIKNQKFIHAVSERSLSLDAYFPSKNKFKKITNKIWIVHLRVKWNCEKKGLIGVSNSQKLSESKHVHEHDFRVSRPPIEPK